MHIYLYYFCDGCGRLISWSGPESGMVYQYEVLFRGCCKIKMQQYSTQKTCNNKGIGPQTKLKLLRLRVGFCALFLRRIILSPVVSASAMGDGNQKRDISGDEKSS